MKIKKSFLGLSLALMTVAISNGFANAQPDPNAQAMGMNPPAAGMDWVKMTPEQRREAAQKFVEQTLRGGMAGLGYTDKALQDDVIAFSAENEKLLEPVREKHRKVVQALMNNASDDEVAALMAGLQASIEEATAKRQESIAALDKKIGFSKEPRLAAMLSLAGLTGNETSFIGGALGSIMAAMGNMMAAGDAIKPPDAGNAPPPARQQ